MGFRRARGYGSLATRRPFLSFIANLGKTLSSKQNNHLGRRQVSFGETLGVLACLLAAVMLMSMGWLMASNKVAQAKAHGTSAISVPL